MSRPDDLNGQQLVNILTIIGRSREPLVVRRQGRRLVDLTNLCIGNWIVLELIGRRRYGKDGHSVQAIWRCRCRLCGRERDVFGSNLRRGLSKSCGCTRLEKLHRLALHPDPPDR